MMDNREQQLKEQRKNSRLPGLGVSGKGLKALTIFLLIIGRIRFGLDLIKWKVAFWYNVIFSISLYLLLLLYLKPSSPGSHLQDLLSYWCGRKVLFYSNPSPLQLPKKSLLLIYQC